MKELAFVAFVVLFIFAGPMLLLWSLNTLFPVLAIPYTFWTWFAALILGGSITSHKTSSK